MDKNFPKHWVETKLGDIATQPQYGWTTKANKKGVYKYFRTTDINSPVNWDLVPYCEKLPKNIEDYLIKKDDILVSRAGSVGQNIRFNEDHLNCLFASYLIRFRPLNPIDSKFIEYYLRTKEFWDFITESQAGIAVPNVNASKLSDLPIPLPPLNEQKRIVEKLDALLPKVKSAKARLEKIPAILKKFRQSVLAAACSGKLTEEWREEYAKRIGKELPEWEELILSKICELITKGASPNWQGIKYVKDEQVLFITSENVYNFELRLEEKKYVEFSFNNKQKRSILKKGDLLTNIVGASIGRTALYNLDNIANINQAVALIRLKNEKQIPFYYLYFNSPHYIEKLNTKKVDVARANISLNDLKEMVVPLPPLEEQHEIVRRVEKLFTIADKVEEKYKKAMARVEKLEQAILAKAFRGELVEPDPNDEPAEELLKRILEEKAKLEGGKKSKKPRTRKK